MDVVHNPFDISFTTVPDVYIQTDTLLKAVNTIVGSASANAYFITGVRGSGKTVMLNRLVQELTRLSSKDLGYKFVEVKLPDSENLITDLFTGLKMLLEPFNSDLKKISVSFPEVFSLSAEWDTNHIPASMNMAILQMVKVLSKRGFHILITMDEIKITPELKRLAQLFNAMKSYQLNASLLISGLPEMIDRIRNEENLTFLYRAARFYTDTLSGFAMAENYIKYLQCSNEFAEYLARLTKGYPFAFQVFGYILYNKIYAPGYGQPVWNKQLVDSILPDVKNLLFDKAYVKLYEGLPEQERYYLKFVDDHLRLTDMADKMGWKTGHVGRYRSILLRKRLIVSLQRGYVDYALPYFGYYIKQTTNEMSLFYLGDD